MTGSASFMFVLSAADTNDIATPPELGTELTGLFPGAQFSLIEKRRPLSFIEQPEQMTET